MIERLPRIVVIAAALLALPLLAYMAYHRSVYLTNPLFLSGFVMLEFLMASVCAYRRAFLVIVILSFLFSGIYMPIGVGLWTVGRWAFLAVGGLVGCFIMLKERSHPFRLFHAFGVFALLSAIISAVVSRYPAFALLKAASLVLLFVYAGTGARLAASGRENRFLAGLVLGAEIFVAGIVLFYADGIESMGNPNSLGAAMGVFAAPILLWGALIQSNSFAHTRRLVLYGAAMYLVFQSHSRAGLLASLVTSSVLCLTLRRYKLFANGLVILIICLTSAIIWNPETATKLFSSASSLLYKDKDPALGLFASRQTPWQAAMESIHKHFWLGSGFGTTDNGLDASDHLSKFVTVEGVSSENGSSYLAIFTWVGMLGILPFAFVLVSLLNKVLRTCLWMLNTASPYHPAVPLAMVTLAGLIHATFEDWLFAPGYYLCVFFWTMAFVLVDFAPWAPLPSFSRPWQPATMSGLRRVAPSR